MALDYISSDKKDGFNRVMFEDNDYNDIVVARVSEDTFVVTTYHDEYGEGAIEEYVSKKNFVDSIARMVDKLGVANEVYEAIENLELEED